MQRLALTIPVLMIASGFASASTILTPAAWGPKVRPDEHFKFEHAFDAQPTWDGSAPVGGDTGYLDITGSVPAGRYAWIDLGENWKDWRIEQTWSKSIRYRTGVANPYSLLWWDDDVDAVNDGVAETTLNFHTQTVDNTGGWRLDVDTSSAPVTPQGRYLMLVSGPNGNAAFSEFAFVGTIVPEPATLSLMAAGLGAALLRRRRR